MVAPSCGYPPERPSNPCNSFGNKLDGQSRFEPLHATGLVKIHQVEHCLQGALMHSKIQNKEKHTNLNHLNSNSIIYPDLNLKK